MAEGTDTTLVLETAFRAVAGTLEPLAPDPLPGPAPVVVGDTSCCRVWSICVTSLSSLNCASWPTNCVGSMGLRGSWFCSCATSSCRNMLFNCCEPGRPLLLLELVPVGVSWG